MNELFDFDLLHDLFPIWFDDIRVHYGEGLTNEMISQSVQEASEFFNMNTPLYIQEDWTTGVITGLTFTENDDILVYNRQQMYDMGITDKEGFDLVMTHEGAHRALQGLDTGFNSHQEELCCDYMSGIRAALNGMDEGKIASSLAGTTESLTHPDGLARVEAIEEGVKFAHDYIEKHDGIAPTFSECLEHFHKTNAFASTTQHHTDQINLRPEHTITEDETIKAYTQSEINAHKAEALRKMDYYKSQHKHHLNRANDYIRANQKSHAEYELSRAKDMEWEFNHFKKDYKIWDNTKPVK